jgi:hypothetical protein
MARLTFFKQKYDESTVLKRATKQAGRDGQLAQAIEVLYFTPGISDADLSQAIPGNPDLSVVRHRLRPLAQQLIDQERARNHEVTGSLSPSEEDEEPTTALKAQPKDVRFSDPQSGLVPTSLDAIEDQAIHIVMRSHSGVTLAAKLKKVILFLFKTFAPLAVLCLTIPESIYVFTHIYRALDTLLSVLTGVFAVLVDFGYLYLTVLVELNKEALFKRRRAGLEVEDYERKALRIQSVLWWIVAAMDMAAQVVFLYGATQGSTFFAYPVVMALVGVRIASLFITMFVVSFAGTELMTDVDVIANEQVERIEKVNKIMVAGAKAREKKEETRIRLEQIEADQDLRREGDRFLKDMYKDARDDAKRTREETRQRRNPNEPSDYLR